MDLLINDKFFLNDCCHNIDENYLSSAVFTVALVNFTYPVAARSRILRLRCAVKWLHRRVGQKVM